MRHVLHLARRLLASVVPNRPSRSELEVVRGILNAAEMRLWESMQVMDRRHSLVVLGRRRVLAPPPDRDDDAAALLHDVGKTASRLGAWSRVLATLAGPRWWRFDLYRRHEQIGTEMLRPATSDIVLGILEGTLGARSEALRAADEI